MKKALLSFTILALGASSQATPLAPDTILKVTAADLESACNLGFSDGDANSTKNKPAEVKPFQQLPGGQLMYVVTPRASAYGICSNRAKQLGEKPTIHAYLLTIGLYGRTGSDRLAAAESWAAALSFQDEKGNEIYRISPTEQSKGELRNWKPNCSKSCVWEGTNFYHFYLSEISKADRDKALTASVVALKYNVGAGIQTQIIEQPEK